MGQRNVYLQFMLFRSHGMMGFTDLDYDLMRFDEAVISGIDCPN